MTCYNADVNHLFVIQDNDHIIAETHEEALALWTKETGLTIADLDEGMDDITQIADDSIIDAWVDDSGDIAAHNDGTLTSKTAGEWAAGSSKGILFSTEY